MLLRRVRENPIAAIGQARVYTLQVMFVLLFVYIVSPVDIVPERVLGLLGLLDDILVLAAVFVFLLATVRRGLAERTP